MPTASSTATSTRLLSLLSLLQVRRSWPGDLLAQRLGVSDRTVRRDVDRLRELGYPVTAVKGPDGGYRLEPGSDLPPLLFDDEQAVALAVALRIAAGMGADIEEPATRALATVRQVMPSRLRHRIDTLEITTVGSVPRGGHPAEAQVAIALSAAIRSAQEVRFDYLTGVEPDDAGPRPIRRIQPRHIVVHTGRWYLIGWEPIQEDWRIYRLDRMKLHVPNGPRFTPREVPGGDAADFLSARFKGSSNDNSWPCEGEVILDLPIARVVPFAAEGVVEQLRPDRTRLRTGSWSWGALAATLAQFEAEIEVVGPDPLRQAFAELARRAQRTASGVPSQSCAPGAMDWS
ncbi:WYL domain-containing protein [Nocardia sp. NPDC005825]|uniref:helix-turn-helix transcriptional regulator n=1 Tax=unclassified Nocardia TaxID=2637762 RepID=UPI0033CBDED5